MVASLIYNEIGGKLKEAAKKLARNITGGRIYNNESSYPSAEEQIMKGVMLGKSYKDEKEGILETEEGVLTDRRSPWYVDGIIERSGIEVNGKLYIKKNHSRPEKYGYCYGTEAEIKGFKEVQTKSKGACI
ncbi:hypothetical protein H1Q59_06565 [Holosporaceae bacterium 'Namur']|nr:hypothetical protein [Holosporaceae bacterium 'Namur']